MKMSDFFKPIELSAQDKLKQKAQWAFDTMVAQVTDNAYAEAAYDLYQLYNGDVDTWSFLKGTIGERYLTPQQLMLVEALFKVSQAGSLEALTENFAKDIPVYFEFHIKW